MIPVLIKELFIISTRCWMKYPLSAEQITTMIRLTNRMSLVLRLRNRRIM